jgi:aspartyl-tRNA(Asn)/glutamyl-tRNA(Gln) amidotransferase subunit B
MDEGSLRCDANVSIRPAGSATLGTKTELKNMNSFAFLKRGVEAEIARQEALVRAGESVVAETLHFDPATGALSPLRSKEEAHDYRYFPEPDLVPLVLDDAMLEAARAAVPELPAARAERYERDLGLTPDRARQLAFRVELGDFYERALDGVDAVALANWVGDELVARLGDADPAESRVAPEALASLVAMVHERKVTSGAARQVLDRLVAEGGDPAEVVESEGLGALGDDDELAAIVDQALAANADAAARIREGNAKAIGPIIGWVMRETKGRADGGEVTRLVHARISSPS